MQKTLVLGAGNTIRGDDGVGIFAARALREQISPSLRNYHLYSRNRKGRLFW